MPYTAQTLYYVKYGTFSDGETFGQATVCHAAEARNFGFSEPISTLIEEHGDAASWTKPRNFAAWYSQRTRRPRYRSWGKTAQPTNDAGIRTLPPPPWRDKRRINGTLEFIDRPVFTQRIGQLGEDLPKHRTLTPLLESAMDSFVVNTAATDVTTRPYSESRARTHSLLHSILHHAARTVFHRTNRPDLAHSLLYRDKLEVSEQSTQAGFGLM